MAVKLFVLGRPGSGKTTASWHIKDAVQFRHFSITHFDDYEILQNMARDDIWCEKFLLKEHDGFDVLDFSVLDTALQGLEGNVKEQLSSLDLITIEFARDDYSKALGHFSTDFLRDAYILFIDADTETCLERIHKRVNAPSSPDDHPSLSDENFKIYYGADSRPYMTKQCKVEYDFLKEIKVIDNNGSQDEFEEKIRQTINDILKQEFPLG